jgi:hypothetical protein
VGETLPYQKTVQINKIETAMDTLYHDEEYFPNVLKLLKILAILRSLLQLPREFSLHLGF